MLKHTVKNKQLMSDLKWHNTKSHLETSPDKMYTNSSVSQTFHPIQVGCFSFLKNGNTSEQQLCLYIGAWPNTSSIKCLQNQLSYNMIQYLSLLMLQQRLDHLGMETCLTVGICTILKHRVFDIQKATEWPRLNIANTLHKDGATAFRTVSNKDSCTVCSYTPSKGGGTYAQVTRKLLYVY